MKAAVITFPGSNCDQDVRLALSRSVNAKVTMVWHTDTTLDGYDLVVLPGGFSYGDYLRPGAMSAKSPIMKAVREHAQRGGLVLGICNGFQILTEAGLLEGALLGNRSQRFICSPCWLKVETNQTPFTCLFTPLERVQFPIAHGDGMFYLPKEGLDRLESSDRVVFRYCPPPEVEMEESDGWENPNGSLNHIAGIVNEKGNVLGMMPHPERATLEALGDTFGVVLWRSIEHWLGRGI
ncbi:MAG: phosphoribosylformylglycinamidine synthase subunit PurQ [Thermanaerothrix sp.]|nr:phosphoribosylformylglycinamidine synthase subunit PurQ [Thermanaerothrix sp.]